MAEEAPRLSKKPGNVVPDRASKTRGRSLAFASLFPTTTIPPSEALTPVLPLLLVVRYSELDNEHDGKRHRVSARETPNLRCITAASLFLGFNMPKMEHGFVETRSFEKGMFAQEPK